MKELITLRDLLRGAELPDYVISVNINHKRQWGIHVTDDFFRENISVFDRESHSRGNDILSVTTEGVQVFCLTASEIAEQEQARVMGDGWSKARDAR